MMREIAMSDNDQALILTLELIHPRKMTSFEKKMISSSN